jgi:hypothetical protein
VGPEAAPIASPTAATASPAQSSSNTQIAAVNGEKPPVIEIRQGGQVSFNGHAAGSAPASQLMRVDELLSSFHELPGKPEHPLAGPPYPLTVWNGVSGAQAKSVLQTAAFAGWALASLSTSQGDVELDTAVAMPKGSGTRYGLLFPEQVLVFIVRQGSLELWSAKKRAGGANTDPNAKSVELPSAETQRLATVSAANLSGVLTALLSAQCKSRDVCGHSILYLENRADFALAAQALGMLAKSATARGAPAPFVQLPLEEPPAAGKPLDIPFPGADIGGRLAPQEIQRVIRASYGDIKTCYEAGLRGNAQLAGRVSVRFVIQRDGTVSSADANIDNDMKDRAVTDCVVQVIHKLVFPKPENGIVTVVYPVMLSPN